MRLLVLIAEDGHTAAIRKARDLGSGQQYSALVLNAPLDTDISGSVSRIWETVEGTLNSAYRYGMDATRPLIDEASRLCTEVTAAVSENAALIQTAISERLNVYLHAVIDGALQQVRSTIIVGGSELTMRIVSVEQKVKLSGSFKGSLTEICEFVAEGEISLSAEYVRAKDL